MSTIGGTFAAVLLFGGVMAALLGGVLIRQLAVVNRASVTVGEVLLPSVRALEEIAASTARYRVGETNYLMATAQKGRDQAQLEIDAQLASIDANQAIYEPAIRSDQERRVYGEFMTLWASYLGEHFQLLELVDAGKIDEAKAKIVAANGLFTDVQAKLSELVQSNAASVKSVQQQARQAYERSRTWALWILAGLIVIGGGFSGYFARRANATLRRVSFDLHHSCDRLMTTAREAAGSAESLARASTDQTATVTRTSASMEQIASATRRNAGDSREAAALVVEAARRVMSSNDVLAQMLRSMEQIKQAGSKVASVAKAIDGIAFQTNLLALNAAVEAARAGDAGLGFGVVADEVKFLAQRAAEAARETVALIDESMNSSQQGAERVAELAVGMAGITDSVERLRGLVDRVNEASAHQSERLDQMTQGLGEFRLVTETTAIASQESAAASDILNTEVIETLNAVRRLEVLTDGAGAAKPAAQAANSHQTPAARFPQASAA